ncbi:MAG: hypothetical protein ACRDWE_09915 [Acidimicrobiales bacterium]
MSRDQLAALVNGLGDLLAVLATTVPEDKAESTAASACSSPMTRAAGW